MEGGKTGQSHIVLVGHGWELGPISIVTGRLKASHMA